MQLYSPKANPNFPLRSYQTHGINLLRQKFSLGLKRVILWAATGAGKGLWMSQIAFNVLTNGKRILVVMRRRELIFQTCDNFKKYHNIHPSPIMSGAKGFDPTNRCQVCSIDTLRARIKTGDVDFLKDFDVIMVDEAHDTNSPTYQDFFEWVSPADKPQKTFIGLTATPFCIGGKPLRFWQSYVKPIEAHELRDMGFLAHTRVFAPAKINTAGIKMSNGDFDQKQLFDRVSESKIIGDVIESYKNYGENKPGILFAVNKDHSSLMAYAFNQAGIPAIHQDESHSSDERREAINKLRSGEIKILCNVNIFSTGVDIPEACVGILARPTMSEVLYIQQVGRLVRTHSSKEYAIILDHACNTERHGFVYEVREAQLEAEGWTKKRVTQSTDSGLKTKDCPNCFAVIESKHTECPYCNHVFEVKVKEIKHADGELTELNENDPTLLRHINGAKLVRRYKSLKNKAIQNGWKPNAIYFKLYNEFGDMIFEFTKAPKWIKSVVDKQRALEAAGVSVPQLSNTQSEGTDNE